MLVLDAAIHQVWSPMGLWGERRGPANWALLGLDIWDVLLECRRGTSEEEPIKEQCKYFGLGDDIRFTPGCLPQLKDVQPQSVPLLGGQHPQGVLGLHGRPGHCGPSR